MMEVENVKYLITSQQRKIWFYGAVEDALIGIPEEARRILANHVVGWGDKPFPVEVEKEVDGLIADVADAESHPLVLANLASLTKCHKVPDLGTWKELRKDFKNAIELADRSNTMAFLNQWRLASRTELS